MKKKLLCIILSLLLVFSMMPATVFADVHGDYGTTECGPVTFKYQNGSWYDRELAFEVYVNNVLAKRVANVEVTTNSLLRINMGFEVADGYHYAVTGIDTESSYYADMSDICVATDGKIYVPDGTSYRFRLNDPDATVKVYLELRQSTGNDAIGNIINSVTKTGSTYTTNYKLFENRTDLAFNYTSAANSDNEPDNFAKVKLFMRNQMNEGSSDYEEAAYAKNMSNNSNNYIEMKSDKYWFYVTGQYGAVTGTSDAGMNALKFASNKSSSATNQCIYNVYAFPLAVTLTENELCTVAQKNVASNGIELRNVEVYVNDDKVDEGKAYFPNRSAMAADDISVTDKTLPDGIARVDTGFVTVDTASKTYRIHYMTTRDPLAPDKEAAIKAINDAAGPAASRSWDVRNAVNAAIRNINNANTAQGVENAKNAGLLAIAKLQAKEELDKLTRYSSRDIKGIATTAKNNINNASSLEAVKNILEQAKADIALAEAKEDAIDDIGTAYWYSTLSRQEKNKIYNEGVAAVNSAKTIEEVNAAKEETISKFSLALAKAQAKAAVEEAAGDDPSDAVEAIVEKYNKENDGLIDKAADQSAVTSAKEAALLEIAKQQAKEVVEEAAGDDPSDAVAAIVEKYNKNNGIIDNATGVEDAKQKAADAVKEIELQLLKEAACAAVDEAAGANPSQSLQYRIRLAKEDINSQTTPEGVAAALERALGTIALSKAKTDAIKAIVEAEGTNPSGRVQYIAGEGMLDVFRANSVEDVQRIAEETVLAIAKQQANEALDKAKGENPSDEVKAIVAQAKDDISKAADPTEVAEILEDALLAIAKQQAKEAIEEAAGPEGDRSDEVKNIVEEYENEIKDAHSVEEVNELKDAALLDIAKQQAKEAIEEAAGPEEDRSDEVQKIVEDAEKVIDEATTPEKVEEIKQQALEAIALQQAKEAAIEEIEEAAGDEPSEKVQEIVEEYEEKINEAETEEEVDKLKEEALEKIKEQYEDELEKYKEQGKKKLEEEAGEDISEEMQEILDEMFEEIDNAKTKKEVDDIVNRGIKKVLEQKAKEEAERKALEDAKKKAIEELKKHDDGSEAAKKIIDDAIAKINAAKSIDEVNAILKAALDALKNLTPFTGDTTVVGLLVALTVASAGAAVVAYKKRVSAK